jgi:hypothetical protein
MMQVRDEELIELIATTLNRSGPDYNAERVSMEFATIRATIVVGALRRASIVTSREHGRRKGDEADAASAGAKAAPLHAPEPAAGCQIIPMKRRPRPAR